MDSRAKKELSFIENDIDTIRRDLNNIAEEMVQFKGIGAEHCQEKIRTISDKFKNTKDNLQKLK